MAKPYKVTNQDVDGTTVRSFSTLKGAAKRFQDMSGYPLPANVNNAETVSDYGTVVWFESSIDNSAVVVDSVETGPQETIIEFEFDGIKGSVVGVASDWVLWGGIGFQRTSAKDGLKEAMDEAVDDYYEAIAWNESCEAMNATEARWVDNGCSNNYGYSE